MEMIQIYTPRIYTLTLRLVRCDISLVFLVWKHHLSPEN